MRGLGGRLEWLQRFRQSTEFGGEKQPAIAPGRVGPTTVSWPAVGVAGPTSCPTASTAHDVKCALWPSAVPARTVVLVAAAIQAVCDNSWRTRRRRCRSWPRPSRLDGAVVRHRPRSKCQAHRSPRRLAAAPGGGDGRLEQGDVARLVRHHVVRHQHRPGCRCGLMSSTATTSSRRACHPRPQQKAFAGLDRRPPQGALRAIDPSHRSSRVKSLAHNMRSLGPRKASSAQPPVEQPLRVAPDSSRRARKVAGPTPGQAITHPAIPRPVTHEHHRYHTTLSDPMQSTSRSGIRG